MITLINFLEYIIFKDSEIVSSMAPNYQINFVLVPYFKNNLETNINASPLFMISYNESINAIFQNWQMDV